MDDTPSDVQDRSGATAEWYLEPERLAERIVEKGGTIEPSGTLWPLSDFVRFRFLRPFEYSLRWSLRYAYAFNGLSVIAVVAGFASSTIAILGASTEVPLFVLGLVVVAATTTNQLWRPGPRSVVRHQTANALRREGWDYLFDRGRYREGNEPEKLSRFVDEVQRVNKAAEAVDEATSGMQPQASDE